VRLLVRETLSLHPATIPTVSSLPPLIRAGPTGEGRDVSMSEARRSACRRPATVLAGDTTERLRVCNVRNSQRNLSGRGFVALSQTGK
jgi:hypothetical protein